MYILRCMCVCIYIYMLAIAGQTAGPNGLTFFEETKIIVQPKAFKNVIEICRYLKLRLGH